ncbi:hypothetical protein PAMA110636_30505 [Paenibacillus macerans]
MNHLFYEYINGFLLEIIVWGLLGTAFSAFIVVLTRFNRRKNQK